MKRRAANIVVFLLLGAIVNVAVAWGCASIARDWSPLVPVDMPENEQRLWWEQHQPKINLTGMYHRSSLGVDIEYFYRDYSYADARRMHAGIPARSLQGMDWYSYEYTTFIYVMNVALPIRPTWPGFAINTIFYAAVLWVMFAFPFVVRRRRRIKRGLCPACAYPVGTSPVCTECGGPVGKRPIV